MKIFLHHLHIDYYEIEVKNTQYGLETITNQVPIEVTDSDRDVIDEFKD